MNDIFTHLEKINKISEAYSEEKIKLQPFWLSVIKFLRKLPFPIFIITSIGFIIFMKFFSKNHNSWWFYQENHILFFTLLIGIITFFILLKIWEILEQGIYKNFKPNGEDFHKNDGTFIAKFLQFPTKIIQENIFIKSLLKENENILKISEKILSTTESLAKHQKFLPVFFEEKYIHKMNFLIFEEIQLLQKILQFSFEKQISHHNFTISKIQNLQENQGKNFTKILELQKIRLQNQKELFEKFLQK